ncbi:hypothetical protein, conserved [Plasmodium gonderi]|uniref:Variable surface protein n=1 Tax=Plasmodium gonderi TaxID=77519 RepID=A0A1Y1JJJ0_PLAGO|nr:hypothetical protein, conserved [Plasmodium gonderi]GAW81585.1 hypothetical protein, conserved [Plasmodium gonderi]
MLRRVTSLLIYSTLLCSIILIPHVHKFNCRYMGKDYLQDLLETGIFEKNTTRIKKEVYENINHTHYKYSLCKTCIKLIQLIKKIIKNKKETYVDIAIEDTLEINLCDSKLWHEHFNYDELLYNEHVVEYCKNTLKIIKEKIEQFIYQLYDQEELFYQKVCLHINQICKIAIQEEQNNFSNSAKIKLIYEVYSDYLTAEEEFNRTSKGMPYKKIGNDKDSKLALKRTNYAIVQSQIRTMYQKKLSDDFESNKFKLIKISKLDDNVLEVFLGMREQNMFKFLFYYPILEIKIKIHRALDDSDILLQNYENDLITDDNNFLLYKQYTINKL